MNKKTCHWDDKSTRPKDPVAEHQTPSSEMVSSNTQAVKPTIVSGPPREPGSASSVQTLPPMGKTRNGTSQVTNELRLAQLQTEAQQLRRLLGLEANTTSHGTMTASDLAPDGPAGVQAAAAVKASRDVGCQTDTAEVISQVAFAWIEVPRC